MGGRTAFAFARRNLERMTDDEAVVHFCVDRSRLFELGERRWSKKRNVTVRPPSAMRRDLGDICLIALAFIYGTEDMMSMTQVVSELSE
jgi:hypothetical protein